MCSSQECRQKCKEKKLTPLAVHRDAQHNRQMMLRTLQRKRTFAFGSLLQFVPKWSRRHTLYLHLEPLYIHISALFSSYLSPSTPLRLFSLARPFDRLFMSLHEDGLQRGGRRLLSLALLLQFGYSCRAVIKRV